MRFLIEMIVFIVFMVLLFLVPMGLMYYVNRTMDEIEARPAAIRKLDESSTEE